MGRRTPLGYRAAPAGHDLAVLLALLVALLPIGYVVARQSGARPAKRAARLRGP